MLFDLLVLLKLIDFLVFEFVDEDIGSKKSEGKKWSFWFMFMDNGGLYNKYKF